MMNDGVRNRHHRKLQSKNRDDGIIIIFYPNMLEHRPFYESPKSYSTPIQSLT